ncbi:intermembrane lipid transfer protein VPS13B isoform X1 [Drosophila albomicans]|uniref:Intermembrane lipid transfer protein VPS13B isoform X1 n=1 Tax=Drosophila albomicans TaxID=7291 RepID=A0A6P8XN42_DROAB|nr:intermembrane lipid transfer protein VPS13B isoform X1 [Drosophila albomicans]
MFKLESYITPILLNYVAKYVKNIRDEDAQVSLWEGEVTFQNLDLRLDVLEEELNLPFELVSGHIHELSIQVPWTKLTSEPVRIEINTIEFVAKLPDEEDKKQQLAERRRQRLSGDVVDEQQGGGAINSSVVNKIINNINLQCHNIILKYVDDDIVVSMNVQYLNFSSANELWEPAMMDVNPVQVLMRKLLQVSDLTICLDKRNTAGKIEVCQEPILYRCTLELRVLRKYNVNTLNTSSTTRIGVFTKSLDINVSSLQFPMVMRLVKILLELKPANIEEDSFVLEDPVEPPTSDSMQQRVAPDAPNTMFGWAWNLLPSFEATAPPAADEPIGHFFDVGVYAEQLNFQLKNSEIFTDQVMGGIKRIRYTPIMRISLGGIYYERSQLKESDWANVRAGLSSLNMEPLGIYRSEDPMTQNLMNTQEAENERGFVDKSLFDEQYMFADRPWCSNNHDEYYARNTDDYMLYRSPVLAFDIVEYRAPQAQTRSHVMQGAQLKDAGLRVKYRLLSAGITFHFSQSFLQVKNVISDLLRPYDYTGYHAEAASENVNRPVTRDQEYKNEYMTYSDIEYLMRFMPVCNYHVDLRNMTVKFYPRQQSYEGSTAANQHRLSTTFSQTLLPYLQVNMSSVVGTICGPANPKRLVHLITHLQDKPREIIDSCYNFYNLHVKNLTVMALNTNPEMGKAKLVNIPSMQVNFNRLVLPHLWRPNVAALESAEIISELISLEFSKRELVLLNRMILLIIAYDSGRLGALVRLVARANLSSDVIKLQTLVTKLRFNYRKYHTHYAMLLSLRNLNTDVYHTMMHVRNVIISTNKGINNKWLELQLQIPREGYEESEDLKRPATAVCLWLENFRVTLDVYLVQFFNCFNFNDCVENADVEADSDTLSLLERNQSFSNLSYTSAPLIKPSNIDRQPRRAMRNSRKISIPAETIHLSSEREEKSVHTQVNTETNEESNEVLLDMSALIERLTSIVVVVDMAKARIDVCEVMLRKTTKEQTVEYTAIRLPHTKITSSNCDHVIRGNIRTTIHMTSGRTELCKWVIDLHDFCMSLRRGTKSELIVAPVQTTVTIALSQKVTDKPRPKKTKPVESFIEDSDLDLGGQQSKKVDWHEAKPSTESLRTVSINVHVDMSEISIFGRRLKLLHEHYEIVYSIYKAIRHLDANNECMDIAAKRLLQIYTGSVANYSNIKDFLDLDPDYIPSSISFVQEEGVSLIIFCQWTIPRISLEMETGGTRRQRKIVMNFEDLLLNVDKHPDFSKFTCKVENVSLNYYEANQPTDFKLVDNIYIKMLPDSSNLPMISVVVTTVSLHDFYSKIGAINLHNKQHTISELIIDLQPIEMILDLDKIAEFALLQCEILDIMRTSHRLGSSNEELVQKETMLTVQDLPIVHLNSKGIYIYIPQETEKKRYSVLLLRIESIKLTPTVENPLVRSLIRQDIYNKAAELNMLNTPGSLVEDRQYELSVLNISLSSGNWEQTQKYRLAKTLSDEHNNPAFEWNNQEQTTELEHMVIFKEFDFITIYAPAMCFDRFLVAGQIIEYNCLTDFLATLNTQQIRLMSRLMEQLLRLRNILDLECHRSQSMTRSGGNSSNISLAASSNSTNPNYSTKTARISNRHTTGTQMPMRGSFLDAQSSSEFMMDASQCDSGINMPKNAQATQSQPHFWLPETTESHVGTRHRLSYPSSVSFVAGKFELQIYDAVEVENKVLLKPLLQITISQPSFLSKKTLHVSTTQASLFDFQIHLAKTLEEREPLIGSQINSERFSEFIFDTMPGPLGSSGIPPPLLSLKAQRDRTQQLEVDVELGKPLLIRLCERSVKLLLSDLISIHTLLQETPYFAVRTEKPVVNSTPMQQLKLYCFNADRMHLVCERLAIKFYDEKRAFNVSAICLDLNANVKFNMRPNKASIKATLGSFLVQAGKRIFLHPLLIRFSTDLLSEPWCDQLLISSILKLNVLHIDASVMSILQLRLAKDKMDSIMEHVNSEWQQFLHNRPAIGMPLVLPTDTLFKFKPLQSQIVRSKTSLKPKAEFYQDDLRAGAFQFVYLKTDSVLPMPYQVQIIKKNYGIVCWRYPQPRQMHTIYIYPVPMPVDNPIHIKCRMEYFSETHETFLHYCDFELSEISSKQLTPPERSISATIWRVVIMQSLISVDGTCFDADEDDDLQSIESNRVVNDYKGNLDNDFILHPKVLVGCMRIDTTFDVQQVPKLQLLLCCQDIVVNLLNMPNAANVLPLQLKKYDLKLTTDLTQTFLTVHMENLRIHSNVYTRSNYSIDTNFRSRIKCLDYGFFNMVDILEPMTFQSYLRFNRSRRQLNANIVLDKLRINCGPWVIHTLLCSKQHWLEVMQQNKVVNTLMPRVVIVNRMQCPISFGQTGTTERILVTPQEVSLYYFSSDYHSQELTFFKPSTDKDKVEVSESVHIALKFEEKRRVRHVRIGNACLTIKQGKLSATQVYVLIKGQIEVVNMASFRLITDFRSEVVSSEEHNLPGDWLPAKGRTSFYKTVMRNENIVMRLKLSSDQSKGRTGDIPLKPNNNLPWLVKVPTQQPQQFISVWVRILREDIPLEGMEDGFQPQKILVSIWPIFEICNLLSWDLPATETTTDEQLVIAKQGGSQQLNTATTHSTEHPVKFNFPCELGEASQSEYTFMLKNMDWQKFFNYDSAEWTIETTLQRLNKTPKPKWPFDDDEEMRVQRISKVLDKLDIQYCVKPTREFSCTLGLEVSAWGMFINATGVPVSLSLPKEGARYPIGANCLEMLPVISGYFTIDVTFGSNWIPSMPICLEQQMQAVQTSSGIGRPVVLRVNSYVDLVVVRNEDVFRIILEYKMEDGRRVFKLRSKFIIANFTDVVLHAMPLTMDHKETSSREDVSLLDMTKNIRNLLPIKAKEKSIGVTMEMFHDLNARKTKHTSDTAFVYFVSFAANNTQHISIPVPLAMPFTRRCFSVQNGKESIPLTITFIEKDNIYYLNVFRDTAPTIVISNNTNVKFIVAQTTASGNSNVTCTTSEFAGKHFEWNQLIEPYSKCYYSPPQMYANFPDVEYSMCNLSLALYNAPSTCSKNKIGWSKPIRTDKSWQKFMHVPNHGDIKVIICDKHRVIRFNIYYIAQQMEFSVKDLRSRLTKPDEDATLMLPENVLKASFHDHEKEDLSEPEEEIINADCMHFQQECEQKIQLNLRTFIKSFVFSLQTNNREQDYLKTEVCNMYADDVMLAYNDDDDQRVLHLQLPNMQIDNQLYTNGKYDFPVLLCAQQLYKRNCCLPLVYDLDAVYKRQAERMPVSLLSFVFYQDELHLQSVRCQLQPLRVYIEDAYLNQLLDTLVECEPSNCVYTPPLDTERVELADGQTLLPTHLVTQALYISEPLRLDSFVVEPLSLLLSVHTSSRLYIALDHSPLSFSRYERHQILTVPLRFGQSLGLHYLSGAIFGAGWVVGSLEILGSPSGLARSFSTGLRDFISMPVQGLFRGPWGFVVGVTQGSASLLRNVTAGTVNSVTKLAGSVARNLDRLTLDSEHIELTEARRRARPQGFADGLTQGLTGLGISLLGAVGGIAHHTLEARSSVGVITGLTKGIVGALTKPISGAAEMLALTGQGVLHTVGFNTMPQQVEPSTTRNVALHASSYRIWRYLPPQLKKDQILFFQDITLLLNGQMLPALLFVTSTVLVIIELQREDLTFIASVLKVEVVADREDPTKLYLSLRPEQADGIEGQLRYTNERIKSFLSSSWAHVKFNDSLSDLLHVSDHEEDDEHRQSQCTFFLKQNMGEHLMHYLKVIRQTQ